MAAAKIESFSVCRFVISLFLLSITFGPTSSRVPESLQADWQVSCLWRNAPKNRRNWWGKCEKVQGVTENVSSHKEAQRQKSGIKLCGFCAFLGLSVYRGGWRGAAAGRFGEVPCVYRKSISTLGRRCSTLSAAALRSQLEFRGGECLRPPDLLRVQNHRAASLAIPLQHTRCERRS